MEYGSKISEPAREKGTELQEVLNKLHDRGQRLEKLASRLNQLNNKMMDESGSDVKTPTREQAPSPYAPGHLSSLNSCVDGFELMADRIEREVSKLEKII